MKELWQLNWQRLRRTHLLRWLALAALVLTSGLFLVTKWQQNEFRQTEMQTLDHQLFDLASDVEQFPAVPKKLPQDKAKNDYWQLVILKTDLVKALAQEKSGVKTHRGVDYMQGKQRSLRAVLKLNHYERGASETYLHLSTQQAKTQRAQLLRLSERGQTYEPFNVSLSRWGFLRHILTLVTQPVVLIVLGLLINWLWLDTFRLTGAKFIWLQIKQKRALLGVNSLLAFSLTLGFVAIVLLLGLLLATLFGAPYLTGGAVNAAYPLTVKLTLGKLLGRLVIFLPILTWFVLGLDQLLVLSLRQINLILGSSILVGAGLTYVPILQQTWNPFYQLTQVDKMPNSWLAGGVLLLCAVGLTLLVYWRLARYYPAEN